MNPLYFEGGIWRSETSANEAEIAKDLVYIASFDFSAPTTEGIETIHDLLSGAPFTWDTWKEDMMALSERHPEATFVLYVTDPEDTSNDKHAYFHNGSYQIYTHEEIFIKTQTKPREHAVKALKTQL